MSTVGNAVQSMLIRGSRRFGPYGPKTGTKEYSKGKGGWKGGFVTSKGRFIKDASKMRYLNVPDLEGFKLTPYVAKDTPKIKVPPPAMPTI